MFMALQDDVRGFEADFTEDGLSWGRIADVFEGDDGHVINFGMISAKGDCHL